MSYIYLCFISIREPRSRGYVQDERYIAIEHRDVRRDCVNFAQRHMDAQDCRDAGAERRVRNLLRTGPSSDIKTIGG